MLLQAIYDSFESIPEFARAEYEQKNGKWHLKQDAIQGGAEHLNPGLAANRDALRTEKETAAQRATAAEQRANQAEAELSRYKSPGTVILSAEDAKSWKAYTELGDIKTVKAMVSEYPTLKGQITQAEKEKALQAAAQAAGVSFDVLNDQLKMPGREKLKVVVKDMTTQNAQGQPQTVKQAFMVVPTQAEGGAIQLTEQPLIEYAKNNWPSYVVSALQAQQQTPAQPQPTLPINTAQPIVNPPAVPAVPPTGPSPTAPLNPADPYALAQKFNAARDTRPNPLNPTPVQQPGA